MCIKWEFVLTTQFVIVNEVSIVLGSTIFHCTDTDVLNMILIDLHVLNMTFVMLFDKTTHAVPYSGVFSGRGGGKLLCFSWLRNKPQIIYTRKLIR